MTTIDPGIAMPDLDGIDWLNADGDERVVLTERERMLIQNAYRDGYADGERHGYKEGGIDALTQATHLTQMMGSATWQRSLELLRYFAGLND